MKVLAVVNRKGGVGKTTIAVHLAVFLQEQGHRVIFIDADAAVGDSSPAANWARAAAGKAKGQGMQVVRRSDKDALGRLVRDLRAEQSVDYVVIDGPASSDEAGRVVLMVCDRAFVPCGPSPLDSESLSEFVGVAEIVLGYVNRRVADVLILVPNRLQTSYRSSAELVEGLGTYSSETGIPVSDGLKLRQAYPESVTQSTVAWHLEQGSSQPGLEMQVLCQELVDFVTKEVAPNS